MAITGKQVRQLRSMANNLKPTVIVGKEGVTANILKQVNEGLEAHELIKVSVLCETGSQAAEARDHILALAARGFDEAPAAAVPVTPVATPAATPDHPIGASPGLGIGPARSAQTRPASIPELPAEAPAIEWWRLGAAIAAVRRTIGQLRTRTARDAGEAAAAIFDAHRLLLEDDALLDAARARIDRGAPAAAAWSAAMHDLAAELAAMPDPYLRARAGDVTAVGDQVLRAMLGASAPAPGPAGVLIAADLAPAEAAELDPAQVAAVVLAFGSPLAHSVILLRAKGIPAVVGAGPAVLSIPDGTIVTVDGIRWPLAWAVGGLAWAAKLAALALGLLALEAGTARMRVAAVPQGLGLALLLALLAAVLLFVGQGGA